MSITIEDIVNSLLNNIYVVNYEEDSPKYILLRDFVRKHHKLPEALSIVYSPMFLYFPEELSKKYPNIFCLWFRFDNTPFEDDVVYLFARYIFFDEKNISLLTKVPELLILSKSELEDMILRVEK